MKLVVPLVYVHRNSGGVFVDLVSPMDPDLSSCDPPHPFNAPVVVPSRGHLYLTETIWVGIGDWDYQAGRNARRDATAREVRNL